MKDNITQYIDSSNLLKQPTQYAIYISYVITESRVTRQREWERERSFEYKTINIIYNRAKNTSAWGIV